MARASALPSTRLAGPRRRLELPLVLATARAGLGHRNEAAVALEEATSTCRATGLLDDDVADEGDDDERGGGGR